MTAGAVCVKTGVQGGWEVTDGGWVCGRCVYQEPLASAEPSRPPAGAAAAAQTIEVLHWNTRHETAPDPRTSSHVPWSQGHLDAPVLTHPDGPGGCGHWPLLRTSVKGLRRCWSPSLCSRWSAWDSRLSPRPRTCSPECEWRELFICEREKSLYWITR